MPSKKPHADAEPVLTKHGVAMVVNLLREVRAHLEATGQRDHPFTGRIDDAIEHLQTGH